MKTANILLAVLILTFSGCAGDQGSNTNTAASSNASRTTGNAPMISSTSNTSVSQTKTAAKKDLGGGGGGSENKIVAQQISLDQASQSQTPPTVTERKIIRNADLQFEAESPEESQRKITAIAESKGGFVVESQQSSSDVRTATRDIVTMTVRVPAAKFGETLEEIRKTVSRTVVETVKSDDVTEEFIDIEAQMKAKKALEAQFLEIMKRANTVEDALEVQRQLAEVRGEIEVIEGRMRFLENQTSLSTIKIRIQTPTVFSTNSTGFFYRLSEAFGNGFNAAQNFILALVTFLIALLPFLIFIVLPIYLFIRYFLKRRRQQLTAIEIAQEELKTE